MVNKLQNIVKQRQEYQEMINNQSEGSSTQHLHGHDRVKAQ